MNQENPIECQPKPNEQRIEFLDILRGIAVLFIYAANIVFFSGYLNFSPEHQLAWTILPTDRVLDFLNYTLVDGKFYTIFSLLFGIGCMVQYQSSLAQNKTFAHFFRRRMFWLLILGAIHLCFIWLGDILTLYALLGFVLVYFVDYSDKRLLRWSVILLLLPIVSWVFIHFIQLDYPDIFRQGAAQYWEYFGFPLSEWEGKKYPKFLHIFQNESLSDFFIMNIGNSLMRVYQVLDDGRIFKVLGIFLIGLVAGRHILKNELLQNTTLLKKLAFWGIGIGLPFSVFRTYIDFFLKYTSDFWSFMSTVTYAIGTLPLGLGYCSLIVFLYHKRPKILQHFAPVGRMAFTNYVSQTVISIVLFYGIGFNLAGKFGFTFVMGICLVIFLIQVLFSKSWLSKFQYGPLEWVWRSLTYGKKQPFRKTNN